MMHMYSVGRVVSAFLNSGESACRPPPPKQQQKNNNNNSNTRIRYVTTLVSHELLPAFQPYATSK